MGDVPRARVLQTSAINPMGTDPTEEERWIESATRQNQELASLLAGATPEQREAVFGALQGNLPTASEVEAVIRRRDNFTRQGQTSQRPSPEAPPAEEPLPSYDMQLTPPSPSEDMAPVSPPQPTRQAPAPAGRFARLGSALFGLFTLPFANRASTEPTNTEPDHLHTPSCSPHSRRSKRDS